nr:LysM peptidoglycan-binding and 3D domain-containing protein [Sporosarcina sp. G11-34]
MKKVFTALLVASAVLIGGAAESSAASEHSVKKGDSLYKISGIHGVSVSNLMNWNNLKSTVIYPNQKLVVGSKTVKSSASKTTKSSASATVYKVKRGDSLSKIAKMYKVSVSNLKSWNNLTSTIIYPNQALSVKGSASAAQKSTVAPKAAAKSAPKAAAKAKPKATQKTPSRSNEPEGKKSFTVSATAYTASCTGCSGITKTGINLKKNPGMKVIAVDPSVIKLGTKVHVEGYGYAVAGDIGGAIKGNKIDVFIPTKNAAYKWGRKNVKITILD